jgi:hypothetical protein
LADKPLPWATPELLILIALLESLRTLKGVDWCQGLVGPMRDALSRSFPPNVMEMAVGKTPELMAYAEAQRGAADLLRRMCLACAACPLGRE